MATPDLADPGLYEAGVPHEMFAALRRDNPVHWNPRPDGAGFWAVTRMAEIVAVSRDPALFSSAHERGGHRLFDENRVGLIGAEDATLGIPFISTDPPTHTRYRKILMPALSPGRLRGIEDRIRTRVEALVDAIPGDEPVDVVAVLNAPLPLLTLAELLGVPADIVPKLYDWTNAFVGEDDAEFRRSPDALATVLAEFFDWARWLFDARLASPGEDIATMLAIASSSAGGPGGFREFASNLVLVLVGGNETTRNSLSHSMVAFAADPASWDSVRTDPAMLATGVREMVRYASPVMHMRRTATADTDLAGTRIAAGDRILLWYVSANRDEAAFERPDTFDLGRGAIQHVGFGSGQHVCIGSRLAEMQIRVAFETLARRTARFDIVEPAVRLRSNFINGIKRLTVRLD